MGAPRFLERQECDEALLSIYFIYFERCILAIFFCSALGKIQRSSQLPNHSGRGAGQIPHRPIAKSYLYNSNRRQQEAQQQNKCI